MDTARDGAPLADKDAVKLDELKAVKAVLRPLRSHTLLLHLRESSQAAHVGLQLARWYAQWRNCLQPTTSAEAADASEPCGHCASCQAFARQQARDYRVFSPEYSTKQGRKRRQPQFRIDSLVAREGGEPNPLRSWLQTPPQFSLRVAVLEGAEYLNEAGANALLKTLEEPPTYACIILLTQRLEAVLATIVSRAVRITVPHQAAPLVPAQGSHPKVVSGQADIEDTDALQQAIDSYLEGLHGSLHQAFDAADKLEKAWLDSDAVAFVPLLRDSLRRTLAPVHYPAALAAVDACDEALTRYAAAGLAVQVMTMQLRAVQAP